MSNSSLVAYTKISPNKTSGRNHTIDTITIHCVVGQCSVETLGNVFAKSSVQASSNYGIGVDGRVGMYVEEKDRSWCSSSSVNDNRAVTIECASDTTAPYSVNDAVYASLIKLVTDICKRNGIKKLVWSTDKNTRVNHLNGANMTVHRDYANKSCPGDYLYNRMGDIADQVNVALGNTKNADWITPIVASSNGTSTSSTSTKADITIIKYGSSGRPTKKLQILLNGLGYSCGTADGIAGSKTLAALRAFQYDNGLDADGIAGAKTWTKLIN